MSICQGCGGVGPFATNYSDCRRARVEKWADDEIQGLLSTHFHSALGIEAVAVKQNIQVGDKKPVDQGRIGSFFGWLDGCGPIAFEIVFAPHETVPDTGSDDGKIYVILRGMADIASP